MSGHHTPSPWEFPEDQERTASGELRYFPHIFIGPVMRYSSGDGSHRARLVINEGPDPEQVAKRSGFGTSMRTAEANARLIAAAPDLLEALEMVLASAHPHPVDHKAMTRAWEIGRAAIAKARGGK